MSVPSRAELQELVLAVGESLLVVMACAGAMAIGWWVLHALVSHQDALRPFTCPPHEAVIGRDDGRRLVCGPIEP